MDTFSRHKEFSFRSIIQEVFFTSKKWGLPIKFLDGQALFLRFMIFGPSLDQCLALSLSQLLMLLPNISKLKFLQGLEILLWLLIELK